MHMVRPSAKLPRRTRARTTDLRGAERTATAAMALLEIRTIGDPVLDKVAEPVISIDDDLRKLLDDMVETMREAPGVGLAGPQVGVSRRILVMEVDGVVYKVVNPRIVASEGRERCSEGCLSVPDVDGDVVRAARVTVEYLDETGTERSFQGEGLLARCIQHEIDHLDGILFITKLGTAARLLLKKRLTAMRRETKERLGLTG